MNDQAKWLINWFVDRGNSIPGNTQEQLQVNYFEAGLIDSLGVIELIADIERHFRIYFNERHFQERRFSTIGGLSNLIAEIITSNKETGEF